MRKHPPQFYERLRRTPSQSSARGSLPILFFGDIYSARIATVGLNPDFEEYTDRSGRIELDGAKRRFHTLTSLGAANRAALTDAQCDRAIQNMLDYFNPRMPVLGRFLNHLIRVSKGAGGSHEQCCAVHLDLIEEATCPRFTKLGEKRPMEARGLLRADLPFLNWEIENFGLSAILCNGRRVYEEVSALLNAVPGPLPPQRSFVWTANAIKVGKRPVGLVGWNKTLGRAGLTKVQEVALGRKIAVKLQALGVRLNC